MKTAGLKLYTASVTGLTMRNKSKSLRFHFLTLYVILAVLCGIVVPALSVHFSVNAFRNFQIQHRQEDIENLWKGTVENDQVIGFALKKLSTPESQRRIHSSLMAKTLSAIVSGASLVPYAVGGNYAMQTGAFAAGRLAQNLINRKNIPQEIPLTDTELIELAGLVENLQDRIISAYYNYKNSLIQLKEIRSKQLLYSRNYAKAMDDEDFLEITLSSTLYDNVTIQEFYCMQTAKKYHLELQRLAGKKVVDNLNLYQYDLNSTLIKGGEQ